MGESSRYDLIPCFSHLRGKIDPTCWHWLQRSIYICTPLPKPKYPNPHTFNQWKYVDHKMLQIPCQDSDSLKSFLQPSLLDESSVVELGALIKIETMHTWDSPDAFERFEVNTQNENVIGLLHINDGGETEKCCKFTLPPAQSSLSLSSLSHSLLPSSSSSSSNQMGAQGGESKTEYHFFASHKQSSSEDQVDTLVEYLKNPEEPASAPRAYKVWLDTNPDIDPTITGMMRGVSESEFFLLFLSEDTSKSFYVRWELEQAIHLKKPIIVVQERHTDHKPFDGWNDLYTPWYAELFKRHFTTIKYRRKRERSIMLEDINTQYDKGNSTSCQEFYAQLERDDLYKSVYRMVCHDSGMRLEMPQSFLVASALRKWLGGPRNPLEDLQRYPAVSLDAIITGYRLIGNVELRVRSIMENILTVLPLCSDVDESYRDGGGAGGGGAGGGAKK